MAMALQGASPYRYTIVPAREVIAELREDDAGFVDGIPATREIR